MKNFKNITGVVQWRLCVGCGACAFACPEEKIELKDIEGEGLRPAVNEEGCRACGTCLTVCPGLGYEGMRESEAPEEFQELERSWGPIMGIWDGYAADPEIRYRGSSGGLVTALALYGLEQRGLEGVWHVGVETDVPWENAPVISRSREELLRRAGSRYAPAAPCAAGALLEAARGPLVFIGKPCDVAGLKKILAVKPHLRGKVKLIIGIFCAGTPATRGTLDLLQRLNVDRTCVQEIGYRGKGWPGVFRADWFRGDRGSVEVPYERAWDFLEKYRPYRCYLCPDATAELADISCGDPWYRKGDENGQGYSLVLARTEEGRKAVREAVQAGYADLTPRSAQALVDSQKGMLAKRGSIWGRLVAMKIWGLPTPRYPDYHLFRNWLNLSSREKAKSLLGTGKRIWQRKYFRPLPIH